MTKSWGNGTNGAGKPNWLRPSSRSGKPGRWDQKDNCWATKKGWVLKHPDGTTELLVAIRGLDLPGKLGATTIDKVSFSGAAGVGAVSQVKVRFTEQVVVTGSPTLVVATGTHGNLTATYASINTTKNILTFNLTNPASADTLHIAAQSVLLAGGTINEAETAEVTTAANLAISTAVAAAAGNKAVA